MKENTRFTIRWGDCQWRLRPMGEWRQPSPERYEMLSRESDGTVVCYEYGDVGPWTRFRRLTPPLAKLPKPLPASAGVRQTLATVAAASPPRETRGTAAR